MFLELATNSGFIYDVHLSYEFIVAIILMIKKIKIETIATWHPCQHFSILEPPGHEFTYLKTRVAALK